MRNADYLLLFESIIRPAATMFDPDLVIIAGGFDAVDGDPCGLYKLTPEMFGFMTQVI